MKFISLFAGIGGFDLGFERAGMTCVAQVENNAHANQILTRQFPHAQRFEDVTHVGRSNLPDADVICGGFPCQDVSVAGRRAGLAGERSGLWFEFLRILTELTPRWCVIENVPGLLSSNKGADFAAILHGLVGCGYRVCWRVLDAQYFGVAQRRRRLFIVGSLGSGRSAEVLFERESLSGDFASCGETREGTAASAGTGAASEGIYGNTGRGYWQPGVQTLAGRDFKDAKNVVVGTLGKEMGRNRGLGQENETDLIVPVAFGINSEMSVGTELMPTLQGDSPTGGGHPPMTCASFGVRRLTPTECERLQGFPDNWTAGLSDSARYQRLGNAVCVNVAEWLGRRLMEVTA